MKKVDCVECNKYRKLKNLKNCQIFNEALVISSVCDKCVSNNDKLFEEEESTEKLKCFG